MKKSIVIAAVLTVGLAGTSFAQSSFDQDVTIVVPDVNLISASSGAVTLSLTATAGNSLSASDNSTTYSITTNGTGKKLTGVLGGAYASGISLALELTAPTGGTASQTTLTTSAQDLVTGVGQVAESGLTITYSASATASAASNGAGELQTVTVTLTDA